MTVNCAIEAQGSLFALANRSAQVNIPEPGLRGRVAGFSPASRLRLLRKFARINAQSALFLTLTFPERFPDAPQAKDRLRAWFERLRRAYPRVSAIWRMEAQERGAPHFHLILFNIKFLPIEDIRDWWETINADLMDGDPIQIDIEYLPSARKVMGYVSKYTAKVDGARFRHYDGDSFLDNGVYLHAGRMWGVHNKGYIPWPVRQILEFEAVSDELFTAIKSAMRERWEYLNEMPDRGGVIFAADASFLFVQAATLLETI